MASTATATTSAALAGGDADDPSGRQRGLLRGLLREIAAFIHRRERQEQSQPPETRRPGVTATTITSTAASVFAAVRVVCETRIAELEDVTREEPSSTASRSPDPPRLAVAEALLQELLVSLTAIRAREREALLQDETENARALRRLQAELEAQGRRLRGTIERVATGSATSLAEIQRLLRDEMIHELAHDRAADLAERLEAEASLQFAWETIREQKAEIVRLRAENRRLQEAPPSSSPSGASDPKAAIHRLQLELSSHHASNLQILQEHIDQLEGALQSRVHPLHKDLSRGRLSTTMTSTADSRLLPSHLGPGDCDHCRRHAVDALGLATQLKQLRAQAAADQTALVRAAQDHAHMKREHAALTSALITAKRTQEELRQMILDVTDEKLQVQSLSEAQQLTAQKNLALLQRQVDELESWRRRSAEATRQLEQEADDTRRDCERLSREKENLEQVLEALRGRCEELEGVRAEVEGECAVAKATAEETQRIIEQLEADALEQKELSAALGRQLDTALQRAAMAGEETRTVRSLVQSAQARATELEQQRDAERRRLQEQATALEVRDRTIRDLQIQLQEEKDELTRCREKLAASTEASTAMQDELERVQRRVQEMQRHVVAIESRLSSSDEKVRVVSTERDQLRDRVRELRSVVSRLEAQLEAARVECERLERVAAETAKAKATLDKSLRDQQRELRELAEELQELKSTDETQRSARETELAESKTTILMWMSKFNAVTEERDRLVEASGRWQAEVERLTTFTAEQASAHAAELNAAHDETTQTQRRLQDTNEEVTNLQAQIAVLQNDHSDLQAANAETERRLGVLQETLSALQSHYDEGQRRALEVQRDEHTIALTTVDSQWATKVSALETYCASLQASVDEATAQLDACREKSEAQVAELTQLRELVAQREAQTRGQLVEIGVLQADQRVLSQELATKTRRFDLDVGRLERLVETLESRPRLQMQAIGLYFDDRMRQCDRIIEILTGKLSRLETRLGAAVGGIGELSRRHEAALSTAPKEPLPASAALKAALTCSQEAQTETVTQLGIDVDPPRACSVCDVFGAHRDTRRVSVRLSHRQVDRDRRRVRRVACSVRPRPLTTASLMMVVDANAGVTNPMNPMSSRAPAVGSAKTHLQWLRVVLALLMRVRVQSVRMAAVRARNKLRAAHNANARWTRLVLALLWRRRRRSLLSSVHKMHWEAAARAKWRYMGDKLLRRQRRAAIVSRRWFLRCLIEKTKGDRWRIITSFRLWALRCKQQRLEAERQQPTTNPSSTLSSSPPPPSALPASVTLALQECARLLRRFLDQPPATVLDDSEPGDSTELAQLLVESTRQVVQWKATMEQKLDELRVREAQLQRLEAHCTQLQVLVDPRVQPQGPPGQPHEQQPLQQRESSRHQRLVAIEAERRRLNATNITLLEDVIKELRGAAASRLRLRQALDLSTRQLADAERRLARAHVTSALLRAFYHWRLVVATTMTATAVVVAR